MAKKKELIQRRSYSEELRKFIVSEVENGNLTVIQACRIYDIKSGQSVYNWIAKYSRTLKSKPYLVVEKKTA